MYRIPIYKCELVREKSVPIHSKKILAPSDVVPAIREHLGSPDREHFVVVMLTTKHAIIGMNTVSVGSLNQTIIHPREIFKPAFISNAAAIILAHNHPSGDTTPSIEDTEVSKRLVEAGKLLGIEVLDHIIVGDGFYSMKEHADI